MPNPTSCCCLDFRTPWAVWVLALSALGWGQKQLENLWIYAHLNYFLLNWLSSSTRWGFLHWWLQPLLSLQILHIGSVDVPQGSKPWNGWDGLLFGFFFPFHLTCGSALWNFGAFLESKVGITIPQILVQAPCLSVVPTGLGDPFGWGGEGLN